jgi:hypothetical protein
MAKKMTIKELTPEQKQRIFRNVFEEIAFEEERRAKELAENLKMTNAEAMGYDEARDGDFGNWMEANLAEAQQ